MLERRWIYIGAMKANGKVSTCLLQLVQGTHLMSIDFSRQRQAKPMAVCSPSSRIQSMLHIILALDFQHTYFRVFVSDFTFPYATVFRSTDFRTIPMFLRILLPLRGSFSLIQQTFGVRIDYLLRAAEPDLPFA